LKAAVIVGAGIVCLIAFVLSGNIRKANLWGLLLTLPLNLVKHIGTYADKGGGADGFRIDTCDPFIALGLYFLISDIWQGRRRGLRLPKPAYLWMLIMLYGAWCALFGEFRLTAGHELYRMFKDLLLFVLIANELQRTIQFRQLALALGIGTAIEGAIGLAQYFRGRGLGLQILGENAGANINQMALNSIQDERVFRVSGLLLHPNIFGAFLACVLPLMIAMFLLRGKILSHLVYLAALGLGGAALVATLSRSGWASFAASATLTVVLLLLHPALRQRGAVMSSIAVLALLCIGVGFSGRIAQRLFSSRVDAALGREEYKADARRMIAARPLLGFGLNSYVFAMPPYTRYGARNAKTWYGPWLPPVHHIYYLWWAETGIIGLSVHLLMWVWIFFTGIGNLRVRDTTLFAVNAACTCAMVAFAVDGFFSFTLRIDSTLRLFWLLSGTIYAIHYIRIGAAPRPQLPVAGTDAPAKPYRLVSFADGVRTPVQT
jgi:putative inorganic carbon (HCO3(-)) transporter